MKITTPFKFLPLEKVLVVNEDNDNWSICQRRDILNLDKMFSNDETVSYGKDYLGIELKDPFKFKEFITRLKELNTLDAEDILIGYNTPYISVLSENTSLTISVSDNKYMVLFKKIGVQPDFSKETLVAGQLI